MTAMKAIEERMREAVQRHDRCVPDGRRDRQHDGIMQVLPPSLRSHSPQLESVRIRFDDPRPAVSDRDAIRARRASSFGYPLLGRSCDSSRRAPAQRLGASRPRTEESPSRADPLTLGPCSRPSSAPRLSPGPPRPASPSPLLARSRSSPRGPSRIHWHAQSTRAARSVSARVVVQFRSPGSGRCSSVLARSIRRRAVRL